LGTPPTAARPRTKSGKRSAGSQAPASACTCVGLSCPQLPRRPPYEPQLEYTDPDKQQLHLCFGSHTNEPPCVRLWFCPLGVRWNRKPKRWTSGARCQPIWWPCCEHTPPACWPPAARRSTERPAFDQRPAIDEMELELELIQTQAAQKQMLRAEVYARALLV
jgi:hypothetical protein